MTAREKLAGALASTEQALQTLAADAPDAIGRVEAALSAAELVASLRLEEFGAEEEAALRVLLGRLNALGAELESAMRATGMEMQRLRDRQRTSAYERTMGPPRGLPSQG